jgi:hypothetical protein
MPVRWRIALAAIIAVVVVGGFLPHGVLSAGQSTATEVVQAPQAPFGSIPSCADAVCGKGSPAPPAPAPTVALVAMLGGLAVAAMAAARWRQHRAHAGPLPAGTPNPLFHPPQFS